MSFDKKHEGSKFVLGVDDVAGNICARAWQMLLTTAYGAI
jgi:hypothetical protein